MPNNPLYKTRRWRETREKALERDRRRCQDCRKVVGYKPEVHHVIPLADGGPKFDLSNLVTLCIPCHAGRHKALRDAEKDDEPDRWAELVNDLRESPTASVTTA